MLFKQFNVLRGGAAGAKAGGGFDVIRAGIRHAGAQGFFFRLAQSAGFDDDLEDLAAAGRLDLADFLGDAVKITRLGIADVDDHVQLIRALQHGLLRFKHLHTGGVVAKREANDGAHSQAVAVFFLRALHKARGNAGRGHPVVHRFLADLIHLRPGGVRL